MDDYGSKDQLEGWCNCRRCAESNTSIVEGDKLTCPKDTEYCFLSTANPDTYDEKMQELCKEPHCETCLDICRDRRQCLDMKSRSCLLVLKGVLKQLFVLQERRGVLWCGRV